RLVFCSLYNSLELSSTISLFFDGTGTTHIYTLSLHDALPISVRLRREGNERDGRALERQIARLTDDQATQTARAFGYFLHLSNIAEDRDQIQRRRRHELVSRDATHGSLEHTLDVLLGRGIGKARIRRYLASAMQAPVLTAH